MAIGESYLDDIVCSYISLNKKFKCDFNVTTNIDTENIDNINFDTFEIYDYNLNDKFNKNLIVLPLKYLVDKDYEFVIYTNSNVKFRNQFDEKMLINIFQFMREYDFDVYAKSKSSIHEEKSKEISKYENRINHYNLKKFKKWDASLIIDESFMIFKINWKFKIFVSKFEQYLWYNMMNNISSYPYGFDLGVSMFETGMNIATNECGEFMLNVVYE